MPSRLSKIRPRSIISRSSSRASSSHSVSHSVSDGIIKTSSLDPALLSPNAHTRTTASSSVPAGAMNADHSSSNGTMTEVNANVQANPSAIERSEAPNTPTGRSTIRTVASFEEPSDTSSEAHSGRNSGFSGSANSDTSSVASQPQANPQDGSPAVLRPPPGTISAGSIATTSSSMSSSNATLKEAEGAVDGRSLSLKVPDSAGPQDGSPSNREGSPAWDSAVGKAGLGKTGRVINKLVTDNEVLKRDLKIEKLKAEEAKAAARLTEDKMERMQSDYEARLVEQNVNKALLSRKERQVETLQAAVELERKRTAEAVERERNWKAELEKDRRDATVQVEEAKTHSALMEGRYNAIASHWDRQGDAVKQTAAKLRKEIASLVHERNADDSKIITLRDLCDQQDSNIRDLSRQKDEILQQFEAYKRQQEDMLEEIKRSANAREEEQERTLSEAKKVLGELRWALNVKKNVYGAE